MTCTRVVLVDDDEAVRDALSQTLELAELNPTPASSFVMAKDAITADLEGVIVTDIRMPGRDGFHLLDYAQSQDADLPVILLTGEGDIPMAVRAMQQGAFDFIEKPCGPQDFITVVRRALEHRSLALSARREIALAEAGDAASRMLFGTSELAENLRSCARDVAKSRGDVLVTGKPGTGAYKVAEVIHLLSAGSEAPFIKRTAVGLDVGAMLQALDLAKGGSLFIDEVAGLGAEAQFALLDSASDVRVIGGSYRNLERDVEEGRFNHDLFLKLGLHQIHVPSIAERPEDIPVMFRRYVAQASEQANLMPPQITPDVLAGLLSQEWTGNARALMNVAMRFAMGLHEPVPSGGLGLADQMAQTEKAILQAAMAEHKGKVAEAMAALKLPRKTLYDKLAKHGLRPEDFRPQ